MHVQAAAHQVASELQDPGVETGTDAHTGMLQIGRQPVQQVRLVHVAVGRRKLRILQ